MNTESNVDKKVDKAKRILELRKYHQPVFEALGISNALYLPKMFYKPTGKDQLHVSFFISELSKGRDIYTEMVDRDFISEDDKRTLYKWEFNMYWDSEYEKTTSNPVRVLIPISDLKIVDPKKVIVNRAEDDFDNGCDDDDCELNSMTIRDLATILWKIPVSKRQWLNNLVKENWRDK